MTQAAEFLKRVWDLDGYYIIGVHLVNGEWKWFTTTPEGAEEILEQYKETADIYYGVNPRGVDPKGGKGSDSDVTKANTFFADLDFKERRDCTPGIRKDDPNTFELEVCYEENGKTVYVHRPPLEGVLKRLQELRPSFVIDSGNGYQLLWKSIHPLDAAEWKKREEDLLSTLKKLGLSVDPQVKDISRVLRLPGSINHRNGREAKVIYGNGEMVVLLPKEYEKIFDAVLPCFKKAEDRRFNFVGHLSGYLARHNVKLEDAEAIVEALYNAVGLPPEHVKDVKYTYNDFENGGRVTGFPELEKLCEELGAPINKRLLDHGKSEERGEKPVQSFDTLKIYHDFQHGKAFVSTYKAVLVKVLKRVWGETIEEEEPRVKIDKTYVNENGDIKVMRDDDRKKLNEEYLYIKDLSIEVEEYPSFNLPTEIKSDVKISDVYKEVLEFVRQRVDTLRPEDQMAIAVWGVATYFVPIFKFFPYLAPMKLGYNAGGSQLLNTLKKIVPRPKFIFSPTAAAIYRMQVSHDPVALIDELKDNVNKDVFNAVYNILVAGYMKGQMVPRVKKNEEVEFFEPFGAKAIIDQSLVTSQYDIASRCLFVRLIRNPNRISDYSDERQQELVNKLYSTFLIYSPNAYSLYYNMDSGYLGRYDQVFRPLITIARLIDQEDGTLRVEDQLKVVLDDSKNFAEALLIEGDPQKRVSSLVVEYVKDSLGEFMEGKSTIIPKPWHIYEDGENALYIIISDLRRKVSEYAMQIHQKDIEYKYGEGEKAAVSEREWEKIDPELAQVLGGRQFIAILKKFFPDNIKEHRTRPIFVISRGGWDKLDFQKPPSKVESKNKQPSKTPNSYLSQSYSENTNSSNFPPQSPSFDSHFDSENKIQDKGTEKENSKPDAELSRDSSLQFSNNISESKLTNSTRFRLSFDSEIKTMSRNLSTPPPVKNSNDSTPSEKNSMSLTEKGQRIYDFLKKLSTKKEARTALKKLSREEVKLLPELREKGYINFDDTHVWLTLEGLLFISRHQRPRP